MTKHIPLTKGQVALVDDWRYEELNQWKWQAQWNKHTKSFYAVRAEISELGQKTVLMHRYIMGTASEMICDHRNHNTLDNQEHNLRNATYSQSNMNLRVRSDNRLGHKCIKTHGSGYLVRINKNHSMVFCKTYRTLDEAIAARDEAVKKYHGEYSYQGES